MATEAIPKPSVTKPASSGIFSGRTGRKLRENLTAYLFLAPGLFIILAFGIFPILFAGYVSLYKWRIRQNEWRGLENYTNAMGDLAYAFFFIIAIALLVVGIQTAYKAYQTSQEKEIPIQFPAMALIPGFFVSLGLVLILLSFITFFAQDAAIEAGEASKLGNVPLGIVAILLGIVGSVALTRYQHQQVAKTPYSVLPNFGVQAVTTVLTVGLGIAIGVFTLRALNASENTSDIWNNIFQLVIGLIPLAIGYLLWTWASRQSNNVRMFGGMAVAAALLGVGVFLIVSDWSALTTGDSSEDFYLSLTVTIFYSFFTVPFQLGISMILAYLLYQEIAAKGMFRILFFVPYIAPTVATAGIFQQLFTLREDGVANAFIGGLGGTQMKWLQEPAAAIVAFGESLGFESLANADLGGPSLALFVIIIFNIWVYVGYDTVIFLAGLGNIPNTLYEAAKIDGAGRWAIFRHVTFPLLSPTTYFLSVISIIGTFKAFNHVWVLRTPQAQGTTDTASVFFFETFLRQARFGFSTSMAMVLFVIILVLYIIQNRIAREKVFYG